jgi:hypothetical protein
LGVVIFVFGVLAMQGFIAFTKFQALVIKNQDLDGLCAIHDAMFEGEEIVMSGPIAELAATICLEYDEHMESAIEFLGDEIDRKQEELEFELS